jgi:hypothetical protein
MFIDYNLYNRITEEAIYPAQLSDPMRRKMVTQINYFRKNYQDFKRYVLGEKDIEDQRYRLYQPK